MNIKVMLFGALADTIGKRQIEINNISDVDSLKKRLFSDFPKLSKHSFVVAVYKQIVSGSTKLNNGDVVALFTTICRRINVKYR